MKPSFTVLLVLLMLVDLVFLCAGNPISGQLLLRTGVILVAGIFWGREG